ncbi:MAG: hypothetical protein IT372_39445 [Polyangiaceae bacterium]|nr:hypothetical protein [Polyangiaceae bacterium]
MNEREGCVLLKAVFEAAGLAIEEAYPFAEGDASISLDGFDPARRVGYEYVTTEAGDRREITPEVIAALDARMERGELFVLLVDERDVPDEAALRFAAEGFLGALRARGRLA